MAQGRSTEIISMIRRIRTSELPIDDPLSRLTWGQKMLRGAVSSAGLRFALSVPILRSRHDGSAWCAV